MPRAGRVDETGKTGASALREAGASRRGLRRDVAGPWRVALVVVALVPVALPALAEAADPKSLGRARALPARAATRPIAPPRASLLAALPPVSTQAFAPPTFGVAGLVLAPAPPPPPVPEEEPQQPDLRTPKRDRDLDEDARPVLKRKRDVPPFWIDREYDTHRTRAVTLPPLFVHHAPKPGHTDRLLHVNLAFTFGWGTRDGLKRRWLSLPALFFGSFSERKTVWGAVPLLIGYRRVGEQFNFGQFPLVWWWGTKYVKNLLVVPFHYQQKTPDSFRGVSALLFWYGHKDTKDTITDNDRRWFVGAPLFWRFSRGLKRFDFAFLYLGGKNELIGKKWGAVGPLAVWQSREFGNRKILFTLPWVRRTDRARGKSAWAVPLVLTFRHQDRDRSIFSATPLVWHTHNRLEGSKFTMAGPVGRWQDPRQDNLFVAPLWYRFRDKEHDTTTRVFVPFAVARKTPERNAVYTILGGGARTKNGWTAAIPPLLTGFGKSDDGTRRQGVLGLFWHVHKPGPPAERRRAVVLAPAFFYDRNGARVRVGIPPLLTFGGKRGTTTWQTITPFLWFAQDPTQRRQTAVVGPIFHHQKNGDIHGGIAPLAFWGGGPRLRYGVAPLLLFGGATNVQEGTSTFIAPYFAWHSTKTSRTAGSLIVWDVMRDSGKERHTAVVPLFYRRKIGDNRLILSALGGMYKTKDTRTDVWTLFVRRKTENRTVTGVLPLVWAAKERTEGGFVKSFVFVPLVVRRHSPKDDFDMWTPLVWRREIRGERARKGMAVVPFYFRQRQPGGVDVDAGAGFFYSRDPRRHTHTIVAGPFYHRLSRKSLHTGIAPISWWMDSETKRRLISLPVIVHIEDKTKNEHTTVAIPFWFDRRRANGRRTWGAFPFVFGGKRLYNFTRLSLAPPGFVDVFRLARNTRFTGFVPLLWRFRKCGFQSTDDPKCSYELWGSVPLFLYGKDGNGRVTHGSLLYVFDKTKAGWKFYTPLFGVNNQRGKALGWYAGLLGVKTTTTHRRAFFFPLFYWRKHRLEDKSLTLVVPPLFIGRHRNDRRFFQAGLLVWNFRQQHKVTTAIVPPIFLHSHSYAERRLTWLLPLFIRDNQMGKDQAWTAAAAGLWVQRRKGKDFDFVQFPLVWHIERGDDHGTFGAFLWWDIRKNGRQAQVVPGLYTRVATGRGDTKVIGPGLGWWTKGLGPREGDRHWRALFGLFGGGVEDGRRYAAIFGAKVDRGPAKAKVRGGAKAKRQARAETRRAAKIERQAKRANRRALAQTHRKAKRLSRR